MHMSANLSARALIFAVALAGAPAVAAPGLATLELPRESPVGRVSQQVGLTEIAVEYGSPAVGGRKIWGALVPFDRLWSLGGYQAAKIRFSRDVTVGDKPVAAGTYAVFAVPSKNSWTLIFNKNADQLGSAHDYRADLDVARVRVQPKAAPFREHLAFGIPDFSDDGATLELGWEKVKVDVPIKVNTTQEVLSNISSLDNTWRAYANAARYMLETKKDYEQGLKYIDQSLALREDWYNLWIKALLLGAKGSYKDAGAAAERALEAGLKASDPLFPEQEIRRALASWSQKSVAAR